MLQDTLQGRFALCPGCEAIRTAGKDCSSCGTYVPRPGERRSLPADCNCGGHPQEPAGTWDEPPVHVSPQLSWEQAMSQVRRRYVPGH
jgi:hypothetical protein